MNRRSFLKNGILTVSLSRVSNAIGEESFQLQGAKFIGGATRIADRDSSAGYLVTLTRKGDGMSFSGMPAGQRLAIRYASMEASTITVQVNDKFVRKLNIHSSGALTGSYRTGVADLAIPANATLSIVLDAASRDSSD